MYMCVYVYIYIYIYIIVCLNTFLDGFHLYCEIYESRCTCIKWNNSESGSVLIYFGITSVTVLYLSYRRICASSYRSRDFQYVEKPRPVLIV
jgi:hypothetical protein